MCVKLVIYKNKTDKNRFMFNPGSVLGRFRVITHNVQETDLMILFHFITNLMHLFNSELSQFTFKTPHVKNVCDA